MAGMGPLMMMMPFQGVMLQTLIWPLARAGQEGPPGMLASVMDPEQQAAHTFCCMAEAG